MPSYVWIIIIIALSGLWYLWSKYGSLIMAIKNNPEWVHLGMVADRYSTDINGLIGAWDAAAAGENTFTSRLGTFSGALPT